MIFNVVVTMNRCSNMHLIGGVARSSRHNDTARGGLSDVACHRDGGRCSRCQPVHSHHFAGCAVHKHRCLKPDKTYTGITHIMNAQTELPSQEREAKRSLETETHLSGSPSNVQPLPSTGAIVYTSKSYSQPATLMMLEEDVRET